MNTPIIDKNISIGFPALTDLFRGMIAGDNVVWNTDDVADFLPLARRCVDGARVTGKQVVYFRYGKHEPLVSAGENVTVLELTLDQGFEHFVTSLHRAIDSAQPNTYFLFDLLSHLTDEFISEQMLGNFFKLICPYIWDKQHLGYFAILRNHHPYFTTSPIEETTQILVDLFRHDGQVFIQPKKVEYRDSSAMFLVHQWLDDQLIPIQNSADTVEVLSTDNWAGLQSASHRMIGKWDRRFLQAEDLLEKYKRGEVPKKVVDEYLKHLLPQLISLDKKILEMFAEYFELSDIIDVWKRTIGSGTIGGKSVGMLLSRAILNKQCPHLKNVIEHHDSFFVGSDVFYSFLIENDCWWIRKIQQNPNTLFEDSEEGQSRIMNGVFPDQIVKRFSDLLDYMGQMPIIVRSSSLLEDNYGNAFAGQYESVFCTNQGTRKQRLEEFLHAAKSVYASTMSKKALAYRHKRGILDQDEQMALLIQRVSGAQTCDYFYPHMAGVGLSYNPYIWNPDIDPKAGALRLVFGLGTRAVDRHDDDHTRVVALNVPDKPPMGDMDAMRSYAQKKVDCLNLKDNRFESKYFLDLVAQCPDPQFNKFAVIDMEMQRRLRETGGSGIQPLLIDFNAVFRETSFISDIRTILETLRDAYGKEIEVEYTGTMSQDGSIRINLVQCRPLQIEVEEFLSTSPPPPVENRVPILVANGAIMGRSRTLCLDRIIYVSPTAYSELPEQQRYQVANLIGKLTGLKGDSKVENTMLIGPGRWGTSMPSLGVPVSPTAIESVRAVCEMDIMHEGLTPDLSLGTHFFHELIEMDILYIGYLKSGKNNMLDTHFLESSPNQLDKLLPNQSQWAHVVKIIDASTTSPLYLTSNLIEQSAQVFSAGN
ncbi:MAG: pyruvate, phosphate dikinase [Gammaproteobacteria bacterium]|nr:pyruvate, phosphate dikinase [Gammaproteobacteria bacterium]